MAASVVLPREVATAPVCLALGLNRATVYRRRNPAKATAKRPRPSPARALTPRERQEVLDTPHSEHFCDRSPVEVYATLLEGNRYLCSVGSMYRILAANKEIRERRNQLRHPRYQRPELVATRRRRRQDRRGVATCGHAGLLREGQRGTVAGQGAEHLIEMANSARCGRGVVRG